jgi:hypothetical protein
MKRISVVLALLAILVPACSGAPVTSGPVYLPSLEAAPATPFVDANSYPTMRAPESASSQSVSGFEVQYQGARREGKQVYIDICFTLPDSSDWTIWNAHLEYAGQAISEFGTTLVSTQAPAGGQPGLRCDTLQFYVPPDVDLSSAVLTIESLAAPPREGEYCAVYLPKIQQAMSERATGVSVECPDVNGLPTMQITAKPDAMSQEEAEQIVYSDEFYTVRGPWTFTFSLAQ